MNLKSVYHININCTNLERSLEFYKRLGFREVVDFGEGGSPEMGKGLRMPADSRARARLLKIGDDPYCSHIDLIEWINPRSDKPPYEKLNNLGIARVCFYSKDLEKDLEELKGKGVKIFSEPLTVRYKGGQSSVVCFEDPDGTVLELVQFKKTRPKS
jgi:glyoxylase I family protein